MRENQPPSISPVLSSKFLGIVNPGNGGMSTPGTIFQDPQGNASNRFLAVSAIATEISGENAFDNRVESACSIASVFSLGHSFFRAATERSIL